MNSASSSPQRPARALIRRGRAARSPLPVLVTALAVLGGCAIILPLVGMGTRVSWGQLPQLLATPSAQAALWLSIRTCLTSTAICVVLGVPLALLLSRSWPGVRIARVLAVLPMTMPPVVAGIALLSTLGNRGILGAQLRQWGLPIAFSTTAVVIAQVFVSMPFLVVTLEAALRSRDERAETTARTLGAGPWRVLAQITLPLAAPALARGTALALGRSLGEFGATIAFAGSKEGVTRTMPLAIYLEREKDTATSLALAAVLIGLSFIIVGATTVDWSRLVGLLPGGLLGRVGRAVSPSPEPSSDGGPGSGSSSASSPSTAPPRGTGCGQDLQVAFELKARDVVVDLEVGAGRTVALIGPNGSGKSTVCSVVAGLLDAENGRVVLGGRVLDGPGRFVRAGRRQVALLSQDPGVFTHMSVLGNVVFALRCQGVSRGEAIRRARAELVAVGAEHLASRSGGALSGGQAARVALARALATGPRLLVLDEPMSALDVTARQEMRRLVSRRCAEKGLTLLLVTHDVLDLTALAEDVVVLDRGRVVEQGPTARVLSAPRSDFVARLTGTAVLTGVIDGEAGAPGLRLPSGRVVHGRPQDDPTEAETADHSAGLSPGTPGVALVPPDAVALYREAPQGSPRNVLTGRVTGLERSGALVSVRLELEEGQRLSAAVTAGAVAELGIAEGREVYCVIKAVQVRVVAQRG
ncbi:molybdenum ABC transporter permease subunit [Actinomyces naeslundii]|uniref:molybdate ABC transporter permease subunit n=2 Tax=Actinomyces naeslundii TaxID=1655 RepID=UPI00097B715A|nr:molybdate ABC transporter permease subunit [Actinomyces naeslundii]OMG21836.1 molybdenum ABC transporter permease subunit [Actinomyces naeslundii]